MANNLTEKKVIQLWQDLLRGRTELFTDAGEPLKIIYPGRLNDGRGADFRDAVIATRRGLLRGDIEFHVNASDWRAHRHHLDPYYNRVILHVVMWPDTGKAVNLPSGQAMPLLSLHKYLADRLDSSGGYPNGVDLTGENPPEFIPGAMMPCRQAMACLPVGAIMAFLERAGEERFLAKAAVFKEELAQMEAGQVLYQGIMRALGYVRNKRPFLELAGKLPLVMLKAVVESGISDEECLIRQQALLFGTAGLLPSQRHDNHRLNMADRWVAELEAWWAASGHTAGMSASNWCLFKVRPNNSPCRRIAALSYLVLRHRGKDLFPEMVKMVEAASIGQVHCLAPKFMVTGDGYWARHFEFGLDNRINQPTLVGTRRASDIVVNVILPLTFAWSQLTSQPVLRKKALELYRHYPKLASNSLESHMKQQLGLSVFRVRTARQQQGLIHINNTRCIQGKCHRCPLSQLESGNHVQVQPVGFAGSEPVVTAGGNHGGIIGTQDHWRHQDR